MAFAAVSILWGIPYLFIKIAVAEVSPAFVAWSRVLIGAVVLLPVAWRLGAFRNTRSRIPALLAFAALEIAIPFLLIPAGEAYVSSSLAAIVISSMPLAVAVLALRFASHERLTPVRVVGMLMGFAGVVTLMGVGNGRGELFGAG